MSKLEAGILQSSNDLVCLFHKDWDMSAFLMLDVLSLIIKDRGGRLAGGMFDIAVMVSGWYS
jgi:hypothetical protein